MFELLYRRFELGGLFRDSAFAFRNSARAAPASTFAHGPSVGLSSSDASSKAGCLRRAFSSCSVASFNRASR